jgi:hypothetical protein
VPRPDFIFADIASLIPLLEASHLQRLTGTRADEP